VTLDVAFYLAGRLFVQLRAEHFITLPLSNVSLTMSLDGRGDEVAFFRDQPAIREAKD
jgi:hypothetical protein